MSELENNKKESIYQKVTHLPENLINNYKQNNSKKTDKDIEILLPNLSTSNILIINNNINQDQNKIKKINLNKSAIVNDLIYNKEIKLNKNLNLNKSISFPSLNKNNILNEKKKDDYSKKILNYSNRNLNQSLYSKINNVKNSLSNNNNKTNREIAKSNIFRLRHPKFEKPNSNVDRYKYISKSVINYREDKEKTNSNLRLTKIKLNEPFLDKNSSKRLNSSLNNSSTKAKTFFRHDSTICGIPKHSKFFKFSQKDNISAHRIYKYYLKKSQGEITRPIRNYKRLFDDKSKTFLEKLSKIYCENQNFLAILKEIKDNNKIAYKQDFNIEEYQSTLIELLDPRVSHKNLVDMQNEYASLNKKIFGVLEPKGRFTILADKLRYNLPLYLIQKLKKLDKDSILSRMKYYNQFKQFRNKKLVCRYGKDSNYKSK